MTVDLSLLNYYKDLYSGHKIIYVHFLDMDFIFRTLTRKEYKYILQSSPNQYEKEDNICNASCLYPEEFDFGECGFAGINEFVAARIEKESGFQLRAAGALYPSQRGAAQTGLDQSAGQRHQVFPGREADRGCHPGDRAKLLCHRPQLRSDHSPGAAGEDFQ